MEVHKHPHHVTHKKKFSEYMLEFFMLFLAVFLGFVAENIREHITEHRKEKEYMLSFINDLKSDTADLATNFQLADIVSKKTDSLMDIINFGKFDSSIVTLYRLSRLTSRVINVIFDDRTSAQLRTSGMLLVRNEKVADSIRTYWEVRKVMEGISDRLASAGMKATDIAVQLFSSKYYSKQYPRNPFESFSISPDAKLIMNDSLLLAQYCNRKSNYLSILYNYMFHMQQMKAYATRLMALIRDEYQLEDK